MPSKATRMTDRELLERIRDIADMGREVDWVHDESTPSEDFDYICTLIVEHLQKPKRELTPLGSSRIGPDGTVALRLKVRDMLHLFDLLDICIEDMQLSDEHDKALAAVQREVRRVYQTEVCPF
jgi:hypothetical protein